MRPLRCLLGRHRWERPQDEDAFRPSGYVTLDWGAHIVREWETVRVCACGARKVKGGSLLPHDCKVHPEAYGPDGWPLTDEGERMPQRPPQ